MYLESLLWAGMQLAKDKTGILQNLPLTFLYGQQGGNVESEGVPVSYGVELGGKELEEIWVSYWVELGAKELDEISVSYCVELEEEEAKNVPISLIVELGEEDVKKVSIYFIVELGEKELEVNLVSYWFILEGLPVAYKIELGGKVEEGTFSNEVELWGM